MSIGTLSTERLRTTIAPKGKKLIIALIGTADLDARQALYTWIREVHDEALSIQSDCVEVNLHQLEFMSSMCVNVFVGWFVEIMELPIEQQYRVRLVWDSGQLWQRRSVHALRRFAPGLVRSEP